MTTEEKDKLEKALKDIKAEIDANNLDDPRVLRKPAKRRPKELEKKLAPSTERKPKKRVSEVAKSSKRKPKKRFNSKPVVSYTVVDLFKDLGIESEELSGLLKIREFKKLTSSYSWKSKDDSPLSTLIGIVKDFRHVKPKRKPKRRTK